MPEKEKESKRLFVAPRSSAAPSQPLPMERGFPVATCWSLFAHIPFALILSGKNHVLAIWR